MKSPGDPFMASGGGGARRSLCLRQVTTTVQLALFDEQVPQNR